MPSALAVIALSERGTMFDPGPCVYMEKLAGGDDIADLLDLDRPLTETSRSSPRAAASTCATSWSWSSTAPRTPRASRRPRRAARASG